MKTNRNTYKVVRAIRELESKEICHEYFDVFDYGVDVVLSWYGIMEEWQDEESKMLEEYLLDKAYQEELREVVRITQQNFDPIIDALPDREAPSQKLLVLEHRIWKMEMAKKKENPKDSQLFCEVKK